MSIESFSLRVFEKFNMPKFLKSGLVCELNGVLEIIRIALFWIKMIFDASKDAYAAVLYLRSETVQSVNVYIVSSKSKVALLKPEKPLTYWEVSWPQDCGKRCITLLQNLPRQSKV